MPDTHPTRRVHGAVTATTPSPILATLATALRRVAVGMAVAATDGELVDANFAFTRILGGDVGARQRQNILAIIDPDGDGLVAAEWRDLAAGNTDAFQREQHFVQQDGAVRWGIVSISALRDDDGDFAGALVQIQDITAQKVAEATARDSEQRFRRAFEDAAIGMSLGGPDHTCLDANPAYCRIVGRPHDALIGQPFATITHPDDIADYTRQHARLYAGEIDTCQIEKRYLRPDGSTVTGRLTVSAVRAATGVILYDIGQLQDITPYKLAAAALRENETRLRKLVEHLPAALYRQDAPVDGSATYVNPSFATLLGLDPTELPLGFPAFFSRVHPHDRDAVQRGAEQAKRTGEPMDLEYRLQRGDGEWTWVHDRSVLERDASGEPVSWTGLLLDISERVRLEAVLRENEAYLRTILEQAPAAVYRLEPGANARFSYASPRFAALTGLSLDRHSSLEALFARVHPDDIALVRTKDAESRVTGEPCDVEYRLRGQDGNWIWVHDRSTPERDDDGEIVAWYGILLDISEQKQLEVSLRESVQRFRRMFEGAATGMSLADATGAIVDVNAALCRLLGYTRDELLHMTFLKLTHPDDVPGARERMRRIFSGALDAYTVDKRYIRKDGGTVWVTLTSNALGGPEDEVHYSMAQIQDITERKETEAALRESEAYFRSIFEGAGIGMAVAVPDIGFTIVNPAMSRFLGYTPKELLGIDIEAITWPPDREAQNELRDALNRGEIDAYQMEKRYLRKDGAVVWGLLNLTATRDEHGAVTTTFGQVQNINARKEAEAALRESEARFRSIFEGAGIGMAMSLPEPDGRIVVANPAFEQLLGYGPGELVGLRIKEISHTEDYARQEDSILRMRSGELDAYQFEKRFLRRDGGIVSSLLNATSVKDEQGNVTAVIGQVQDITARKEAEAALRASEARFRALIRNDPDVILILDEAMRVVYASPSSVSAFGARPEDILGPILPNLRAVHPADRKHVIALRGIVDGDPGAAASIEARIRHRDLGWRWFLITVANQLDDPGIGGYVFNLRDITERKQAALALQAAFETQQTAIAELERLNQSKSRFLSTISHEFRTPLTAIIGYSELLADQPSDPALVVEDAAVIHREASRLNRMVDDVLLVDRADAGHLPLHIQPVDLNTLVRDVVETFRPLTGGHQIALALDSTLPPIDGDHDRLAQALTNLVSNAVKYSPDGGTITIATSRDGDKTLVSVHDKGIGIADGDLVRVFDRFERVETGIAGRIGGTGLGLSVVKEIVELHGGQIWAESELGIGSTFCLELPGGVRVRG